MCSVELENAFGKVPKSFKMGDDEEVNISFGQISDVFA